MTVDFETLLYEGKAKQIYPTTDPALICVHYKDDATAFNGKKFDRLEQKGELNNAIASLLFTWLRHQGIESHFVDKISPRDQICRRVTIIPLEVIVRNRAAGTMAKRLGLEEGMSLATTVFELSYKNDALGDPLINDTHAVAIGATTFTELREIYGIAEKVNTLLSELFNRAGIDLIDFKLEFGTTPAGELILADEISPDTCRFWEQGTGRKMDKDRFRRDMGGVMEGYREILKRLEEVIDGGM
ncbi:MAG: phosphoribosylaminoimidazolesuccinocarboxamide synthase [Alkalispirochaeta sp.]